MNGVLVVMEARSSLPPVWNRASFEALAAGWQVARTLNLGCSAAILGHQVDQLAGDLAAYSLEGVHTVDHPLLARYSADGFVLALQQFITGHRPAYVILPHTYQVRDFAPALATRFGQVLQSDVISMQDGSTFVRQLFQGKLNAGYHHAGAGPVFVSVQAGTFLADTLPPGTAPILPFPVTLQPDQIRNQYGEPFRETAQTVDLSTAPLIVSVGRGIGEADHISLIQALAAALGAEVAASRPICDNGWLPMERQVGSSGQTVSPRLYLAVGISGAIQHLVGMKASKTIIAINKDPNAPIFEVADFGVVGDLFEIVPALTQAILSAKAE